MTDVAPKLHSPLDDLIARAVAGDHGAFGDLYSEFSQVVYATLARHLGPIAAVEDLVQVVFIKVYREFSDYRGEKPFRAWLNRACFFVVYDHLRKSKPGAVELESLSAANDLEKIVDSDSTPESEFVNSEIRKLSLSVLSGMKPAKRMALVMHDFEGYTLSEVADVLGCSLFTVRTRLSRARREFVEKAEKNKELKQLISWRES